MYTLLPTPCIFIFLKKTLFWHLNLMWHQMKSDVLFYFPWIISFIYKPWPQNTLAGGGMWVFIPRQKMFGSATIVFHGKYFCLSTTLNSEKERNPQQNSERLQKNQIFVFLTSHQLSYFFFFFFFNKLNKSWDMLHSCETVIPNLGLTDYIFLFFLSCNKKSG